MLKTIFSLLLAFGQLVAPARADGPGTGPLAPAPATAASGPPSSPETVRLLLPKDPVALKFEQELESIVAEYNQIRSGGVRLVRATQPGLFSATRDLVAGSLAGQMPEIAAVECAELAALAGARAAVPLDEKRARALLPGARAALWEQSRAAGADGKRTLISLPFQRAMPVLVVDQELIFRAEADPERLPTDWDGLLKLARRLAARVPGAKLAAPLQGERGLWLFEALAGRALWERPVGTKGGVHGGTVGGAGNPAKGAAGTRLRVGTGLGPVIARLARARLDDAILATTELSSEAAMRAFLERRAPLLLTTTDLLPQIAEGAAFRWTAVPLPTLADGAAPTPSGSQLVITRPTEATWKFLEHLYSPRVAARWAAAGGYLPLTRAWTQTREWKDAEGARGKHVALLARLEPRLGSARARATDAQVLPARTEWTRALTGLFPENPARAADPQAALAALNEKLAALGGP